MLMIRGVSKRIIEVNDPDSIYFERAVFYLRPNVREISEEISAMEISRYISCMGIDRRRQRRSLNIGRCIITGLFIIAVTAVIFTLTHQY